MLELDRLVLEHELFESNMQMIRHLQHSVCKPLEGTTLWDLLRETTVGLVATRAAGADLPSIPRCSLLGLLE